MDEAAALPWRARDWATTAANPAGGPRQDASAALAPETVSDQAAEESVTLAASRAALERAQAQRAIIARMLEALPRPAPD